MGWGTFIAGQAIGNARRAGRNSGGSFDIEELDKALTERQIIFETEVLREIKRLQAEGKEVNMVAVRSDMRKLRRAYKRLGPNLELMVVQKAQQKALAGMPVNKAEIEREILDAYKPFSWGKAFLWVFFPAPTLAHYKGRNWRTWLLPSLVFGPMLVIPVLFIKKTPSVEATEGPQEIQSH